MTSVSRASERLALSRQRLRQALRESAAEPPHSHNPVIIAGTFAKEAVQTAVQPMARRNPIGLVLGAAAAGALVFVVRPWRWIFGPAVMASLVPLLVSKAVVTVPKLPWMHLLSSMTRPQPGPQDSSIRKI